MEPKWGHMKVSWDSFGGPLGVLLAALGCIGGPLGIQGSPWVASGRLGGDFQDFPGNSGTPLGCILESFFVVLPFFFNVDFLIEL